LGGRRVFSGVTTRDPQARDPPARKLWAAIAVFVFLSGLGGASGPEFVLGVAFGAFLLYALPVAAGSAIFGRWRGSEE